MKATEDLWNTEKGFLMLMPQTGCGLNREYKQPWVPILTPTYLSMGWAATSNSSSPTPSHNLFQSFHLVWSDVISVLVYLLLDTTTILKVLESILAFVALPYCTGLQLQWWTWKMCDPAINSEWWIWLWRRYHFWTGKGQKLNIELKLFLLNMSIFPCSFLI